ncbi:LuxR family transcriptional regulator [Acinetobacter qingfengensis]|nr:LuxR family transcriptional regulator [Acinetobacter qingfengensis]
MECRGWVTFVDHFIFSITKAVPFTRFFSYDVTLDTANIHAYHAKNLSENAIDYYLKNMCDYDPIYVKNNKHNTMEMARLQDRSIPEPYQDFLYENSVVDNIELFFKKDQNSICGISLIRSSDEGVFSDQEITIIDSCYSMAKFQMQMIQQDTEILPVYNHIEHLTAREQKVMTLILQGKKNQDIADELFVSLATVKTHLQHIFQKTMVNSKQELILKTLSC